MNLRNLLAAAAAAALVPALPAAPAHAAGASVTVVNMAFTPAAVSTALGGTVTWTFQDPVAHTTTSDQGFWDSGARSGGATYSHAFTSAGSFAYHCSIHPLMHGTVKVPPATRGTATTGYRLTWATVKGAGGIAYDVQTRAAGGKWVSLKTGTTGTHARFDPAKPGTYSVRARTTKGGSRSGWSPAVTVTVS